MRICTRCKQPFSDGVNNFCSECAEEEAEDLALVVEYIKQHRNVNVIDVVNNTGVDLQVVLRMMKDGRLRTV